MRRRGPTTEACATRRTRRSSCAAVLISCLALLQCHHAALASDGGAAHHRRHSKCHPPFLGSEDDFIAAEFAPPRDNGKPPEEWSTHCLVLNKACVLHGSIVLFDEETYDRVAASQQGFSKDFIKWDGVVANVYQAAKRNASHLIPNVAMNIDVKSLMRLPTAEELAWAKRVEEEEGTSVFDKCTLPVGIWTHYPSNMAEFINRAVGVLTDLQAKGPPKPASEPPQPRLIDENATLLVGTFNGLPLTSFQHNFVQPFSNHPVATFSAFASQRTCGKQGCAVEAHPRCFSRMVLCRINHCRFRSTYHGVKNVVLPFYKPQLPDKQFFSAWSVDSTLKVLFEVRPDKNARQIVNLKETLEALNTREFSLTGPDGQVLFTRIEARTHSFGASFVEDIAIMQQTDLFIAFHGAGMQNAVFLRNQSATLELRPHSLATKHAWAHLWGPHACELQEFSRHCFFLNVEAEGSWVPGTLERLNLSQTEFERDRDRHIILRFDWLEHMLRQVASVWHDTRAFRRRYHEQQVAYMVYPDGSIKATSNYEPGKDRTWRRRLRRWFLRG